MKYTLNKSDWLRIGKSAGWIKGDNHKKEAMEDDYEDYGEYHRSGAEQEDAFWESLAEEIQNALEEEHIKDVIKYLAEKMINNKITDMSKIEKEVEELAQDVLKETGFTKHEPNLKYFDEALRNAKDDVMYAINNYIGEYQERNQS
jgi:hypothetical protein